MTKGEGKISLGLCAARYRGTRIRPGRKSPLITLHLRLCACWHHLNGFFFLDIFYFSRLLSSVIPFIRVLFEMLVSDQDLDGIFEVDVVLDSVPKALIELTIFSLINVQFCWCLSGKRTPVWRNSVLAHLENNFSREVEIDVFSWKRPGVTLYSRESQDLSSFFLSPPRWDVEESLFLEDFAFSWCLKYRAVFIASFFRSNVILGLEEGWTLWLSFLQTTPLNLTVDENLEAGQQMSHRMLVVERMGCTWKAFWC